MRAGETTGRLSRELPALAFGGWKIGKARPRPDTVAGVRARGKGSSVLHVLLPTARYPGPSGETDVKGDTPRCRILTQP